MNVLYIFVMSFVAYTFIQCISINNFDTITYYVLLLLGSRIPLTYLLSPKKQNATTLVRVKVRVKLLGLRMQG